MNDSRDDGTSGILRTAEIGRPVVEGCPEGSVGKGRRGVNGAVVGMSVLPFLPDVSLNDKETDEKIQ